MARIRSIKPEFCTSEQVMEVSRDARLTFILLWPFCDDGGVHPASLKVIKAEIYPSDDDVTTARVGEWLDELMKHGLIERFVANGQQYISVPGWKNHQRIEKPQPLRHPQPSSEGAVPVLELFGGGLLSQHAGADTEPLPKDYGTATEPLPLGRKEGRREEGGKEPLRSVGVADATTTESGDLFEKFWSAMPKRGPNAANPKVPARQKFETAVKRGADPEDIVAGAEAYARQMRAAGKDRTEHVAQAVTFLSQARWKDVPETETTAHCGQVLEETTALYAAWGVS